MDDELYEELRPRAFAIAYRMLGSVSEAEDIVQEAMLRLHRALERGEDIESPAAYLSTIVTRLAIDELRSARAAPRALRGEWLRSRFSPATRTSPPATPRWPTRSRSRSWSCSRASRPSSVRSSCCARSSTTRTREIAEIVGKSEPAVRQLAERARGHVGEGRQRYSASREQRDELARRFFAATEEGDVKALEELLAEDVVLQGDGGGKAPALARAVHGRARAARTLSAWRKVGARFGGFELVPTEINGQPGAIARTGDGQVISVLALDIAGGKIQAVRGVVNPDKLRHLGPVADVNAILRGQTPDGV